MADHQTLFMYGMCCDGQIDKVRLALGKGGNPNTNLGIKGLTALHVAAENNHEDVVALLLQQPGIDVNVRDNDGRTALHCTAYNPRGSVAAILLQQPSVDVKAADNKGQTALHSAVDAADPEFKYVLRVLLDHPGLDVNVTDNDGWTALHVAVCNGHEDVVALLLDQPGIDVNAADNDEERTALHCAAREGYLGVVSLLLHQPGTNVNGADAEGWTALHYAGCNGNEDVVALLLEQPSIDVNAIDLDGRTAFHHACGGTDVWDNPTILRRMLTHPETDPNVNDQWQGHTPIMELLCNMLYSDGNYGNYDKQRECWQEMLESQRFNLDVKDSDGFSLEDLIRCSLVSQTHLIVSPAWYSTISNKLQPKDGHKS